VRFLLDTNVCIGHLTGRAPPITERLKMLSPSNVVLCSVVKAELWYGAHKSVKNEENLAKLAIFFAPFASVKFDDAEADDLRAAPSGAGCARNAHRTQ